MAVLGAGRSMCLEALGVTGIRGGERMSRYARPEAGSRGSHPGRFRLLRRVDGLSRVW
jgi:hypothetical protein